MSDKKTAPAPAATTSSSQDNALAIVETVKIVPSRKARKSRRGGLTLLPQRIRKYVRNNICVDNISPKAVIALTAACEYMGAEILSSAGNIARDRKRSTIAPVHIESAIRGDAELDKQFKNCRVYHGGVEVGLPFHLLSKNMQKKKRALLDNETKVEKQRIAEELGVPLEQAK